MDRSFQVEASVLGLGNVLAGDDAFGPAVVEFLHRTWAFPDAVEVEDLGTPGLDLMPHLDGRRRVILVDVVRADVPPGTRRRYSRDELLTFAAATRTSPHDPGVKQALSTLELHGRGPESFAIFGVVPARVDDQIRLSPEVEAAVEPTARDIVALLEEWGFPAAERSSPGPFLRWWEKPGSAAGSMLV